MTLYSCRGRAPTPEAHAPRLAPCTQGLAHLAEHLTLAAGEGSGGALGRLIDDLEGDLNAFTAEEATTFCCSWTADADGELAEAEAATEEARALREVSLYICRCTCVSFPSCV